MKPYVSRGGIKLATALQAFAIPVAGRIALDCGASTGGFTDCLLQHGTKLVYAVDAGHSQLAARLTQDPRVQDWSYTNIARVIQTPPTHLPDLITLDLSYLSLRIGIPLATQILAPNGNMLTLFKPLFEIDDPLARRTGLISDPNQIVIALSRLLETISTLPLTPRGAIKLALQPIRGVHEYMLWFSHPTQGAQPWQPSSTDLLTLVTGNGLGPTEELTTQTFFPS
ncbi:MAG: TlyA family rRNA (cytidine-2'-O)-methyltransferase [Chloroflexi bacterium]|nr:TlyA family rRNA (cytidine-2'-O)-methyltransferase [Chloroflexota bacterium]